MKVKTKLHVLLSLFLGVLPGTNTPSSIFQWDFLYEECFFLVVTCSALIVSHQRRQNRCGGHLKILIRPHCPLMFLPPHLALFMYREPGAGVIMDSHSSLDGFCVIHHRITRMTDRATRITTSHLVCNHKHLWLPLLWFQWNLTKTLNSNNFQF